MIFSTSEDRRMRLLSILPSVYIPSSWPRILNKPRISDLRIAALCLFSALIFLSLVGAANAQVELSQPTRRLITQLVDDRSTVTLSGNTRSPANAANDRGIVPDSLPMEHMQLQLQLPNEKEQELDQLIADLHNSASPNFHRWLTPEQFKREFSLAPEDISTITNWLQSNDFTVGMIYPRSIDFSGIAGQVRKAFKTEIHNLQVNGETHIANMSDPQIPAALAPAIVGVASLSDFMPRALNHPRVNYTVGGGAYLVAPADLATIYNFDPLFVNNCSGQGQTIVVIEDSDVFSTSDWNTFRSVLGLSSYNSGSFT
jgi:subtilase family serine protease